MSNDEAKALRADRLDTLKTFIADSIDRKLSEDEVQSIERLDDQLLHLLCAAIDNAVIH